MLNFVEPIFNLECNEFTVNADHAYARLTAKRVYCGLALLIVVLWRVPPSPLPFPPDRLAFHQCPVSSSAKMMLHSQVCTVSEVGRECIGLRISPLQFR